jgi:hypothetical protein
MIMYHNYLSTMHFYPGKTLIDYNIFIYFNNLFKRIMDTIGINFDLMIFDA